MRRTIAILTLIPTLILTGTALAAQPTNNDLPQIDTILQKEKGEVGRNGEKDWGKKVGLCEIKLTITPDDSNELPIHTYLLYEKDSDGKDKYVFGLTTQGSAAMSVCITEQPNETRASMGFVSGAEKPAAKELVQYCHDLFLGRNVSKKQEHVKEWIERICPTRNKF